MAQDIDTVLGWRGDTVLDRDGEKIGSLKELYLDRDERPAWGAVHTGLFGMRQTFVPLADAREVDGGIQLPYAKDHVTDAPSIDPDAQLSDEEEQRLYRHYEVASPTEPEVERERDAEPGPESGETDDAMTRSEEELVVGTRRRVAGKARLKKYVVTEHVQRTVPVQREEVRVEYEPADGDDGRAADDVSHNRGD
jgi:hypothetical protein